jgi:hypothetical protein
LAYAGAGSVGTLLAQSKPAREAVSVLPVEPWARVFEDATQAAIQRLVRQARDDDRSPRDTRPPCVMPVLEVSADIDPRMVVPLPDTDVNLTMPTIEASCAPVRR